MTLDQLIRRVAAELGGALSLDDEVTDLEASEHPNDRQLITDLESCTLASERLASESLTLAQRTTSTEAVEERQVTYQADLARWQTERAATEAKRRLEHMRSLDTPEKRKAEIDLCRSDTLYWINHYAWTADPRADAPLPVCPFLPFDFQAETIRWLEGVIFAERCDGLIEKSRDMGLSWLIVAIALKHWLFDDRFDALFGSRKEDLVDKRGSLDSLFEKIRFLLNRLPSWMLPHGFNPREHSTYMRLINPSTGSALTGESSNASFGRAGRYTVILLDEFASFPSGGYDAWTACSQSARSKIVFSTPKGKLNKFADLRFGSGISVKSLHWQLHPWKDERWYDAQARTMSPEEIAQELDLDYEASQPGRIFPMWSEPHHVITWSEFVALYEKFGQPVRDGYGRPRIPPHWQIARSQDWGSTLDHPTVTLWVGVAAENAPLSGSVFFYREWMAPTGSTPSEVASGIKVRERYDDETKRIRMSLISHEALSERQTYIREHNLFFKAWATGYTEGIAQMQNYLQIDAEHAHPFRLGLMGRPRLFLIVADDQGKAHQTPEGKWYVTSPRNDEGFKRLRSEMPIYHYPASEQGKEVRARRPFKLFDDAVDAARALARQFFVPITPKSEQERENESFPLGLRYEDIARARPQDLDSIQLGQMLITSLRQNRERLIKRQTRGHHEDEW